MLVTAPRRSDLPACHHRFAVPRHSPPQPIIEADTRSVAKQSLGLADVGLRVANVTGARFGIDRLELTSHLALHGLKELLQRNAAAGRDVDDLATGARRMARAKNTVDDVGHVREVAGLFAVSVDGRAAVLAQRADEKRDDPGIRGRWILPRAEDVEVSDRHRLEAVKARKHLAVLLGYQF